MVDVQWYREYKLCSTVYEDYIDGAIWYDTPCNCLDADLMTLLFKMDWNLSPTR